MQADCPSKGLVCRPHLRTQKHLETQRPPKGPFTHGVPNYRKKIQESVKGIRKANHMQPAGPTLRG